MKYYELDPYAWNTMANFYRIINKPEKALEIINKSFKYIKQNPKEICFLDTKAEILYNLKEYKDAYEIFKELLKIDKNDVGIKRFYAETSWKAAKTAFQLKYITQFKELKAISLELMKDYCDDNNFKKKFYNELEMLKV